MMYIDRTINFFIIVILTLWLVPIDRALSKTNMNVERASYQKLLEALPPEKSYQFIEKITKNVNPVMRDRNRQPQKGEMALPDAGWKVVVPNIAGPILRNAVEIFRSYLLDNMAVQTGLHRQQLPFNWKTVKNAIVVGIASQLKGCDSDLKSSKDYQIKVMPNLILVCGFDERGAMYGLYNIEARFNLREAPYLTRTLDITRHSLHEKRMTLTALGWMNWPDSYLEQLSKYGFDAIYASVYSNPNGAPPPSKYKKMRVQNPSRIKNLIYRAGRYGIDVYCPLMFELRGDESDEPRLRALIQDNVRRFPKLKGYILLIEGFYFQELPKHYWKKDKIHDWINKWKHGLDIAVNEFSKLDSKIDVLAWDYNIDFRPDATALKKHVINQYPKNIIPLITWENGKKITFDGESGFLKDYGISESGPSEVAIVQMEAARKRGMKVYAKADGWASWQFGSLPYIPVPQQWHERYKDLAKYKVDGTLESWTYGFQPNFVAELRMWYSWNNAPPLDTLLASIAKRTFGSKGAPHAIAAWQEFSKAIKKLPATGPYVATNSSVSAPFFLEKPKSRAMTINHSFYNPGLWAGPLYVRPEWPYTSSWLTLQSDFTNRKNVVETSYQHIKPFSMSVYDKYMKITAEGFAKGLKLYRKAVLAAPAEKQSAAIKEVIIVEEMQRLVQSTRRLFKFETLRLELAHSTGNQKRVKILDQIEDLVKQEYSSTKLALLASTKDSRLGYQWPYDYIYTTLSLREKLSQLSNVLNDVLPRQRHAGQNMPSPPTILVKPLQKSSISYTRFVFADQPDAKFECRINNAKFKKCLNPFIIPVLKDGIHKVSVRLRNKSGLTSDPTDYSWEIDERYPFNKKN